MKRPLAFGPMRALILLAALLALLPLLSGCPSDDPPGETGAAPDAGSGTVVCRLKWLFNASVAGEIWAQEAGIFRSHGLAVELREGGPEQDAIKDLELGRAHFGIASADQVIRATAKGAEVVVLAQLFQINPLQWIYPADRVAPPSAEDLRGLTVGVTYGGNDEAILMALLRKYKIQEDEMDLYAVHYDYSPFWKGAVDLWPVYRNIEGIILAEKMESMGGRAGFFDPGAFGVRFPANSLITSRTVYEEQPGLVKRFTHAVLEGWRGALAPENRPAVTRAVHRRDRDTPPELIQRQIAATAPMILSGGERPLGSADYAAWRQTGDIMFAQGLLARKVDVGSLLVGPPP